MEKRKNTNVFTRARPVIFISQASCHPINGGLVYVEHPCYIANGPPLRHQFRDELNLLETEFAWSAKAHAALFCRFASGTCSLSDKIPFKFCDTSKYRHDHLAGVGSCVRPRLR